MKAKKSVTIFILLVLSNIILFLAALYIYDPLQIFHKPWGRETTFHKNIRQQAAGIINNYDFDSVILGTSMLENSSANEASKLLGGKFINISMSGSNFFERQVILKYLLKHKKIRQVIYSLDIDMYTEQKRLNKTYPLDNYSYLYDENYFNDIKLYLNDKYIKCLISFSKSKECVGSAKSMDRPTAWYKNKHHAARFGGLDKWFKAHNNPQIKFAFRKISNAIKNIKNNNPRSLRTTEIKILNAKKYIDDTLLQTIQHTPNTEFILIFPPYSRAYYAMLAQYDLPAYEVHKHIVKYLKTKCKKYKNLSIYIYENEEFVDDISNYKDLRHYHYSINSWMLESINNVDSLCEINEDIYIDIMSKKALEYDFLNLGNKINNYLNNKN